MIVRSSLVRRRRRVLLGATASLLFVTAPAPASADPGPHVGALSLSTASVEVAGLALVQVTVKTAVTGWPDDVHSAFLTRTTPSTLPHTPRRVVAVLERTSGTPGSGTYQGTFFVPSTADGDWRVSTISDAEPSTASSGNTSTDRDPRADGLPDATLAVSGTHVPRLRFTLAPSPVPYPGVRYTATAVFTDDRGRPVRGRNVAIEQDNLCVEYASPGRPTDAAGRVARTFRDDAGILTCAFAPLPVPPAGLGWMQSYLDISTRASYGVRLSAAPARTTVRRGSAVTVNGKVVAVGGTTARAAAAGTRVRLQRLVGRTWRNVDVGTVRTSGRFSMAATPPVKGPNVYRVWFPSQDRFAGSVTRSFTITAT